VHGAFWRGTKKGFFNVCAAAQTLKTSLIANSQARVDTIRRVRYLVRARRTNAAVWRTSMTRKNEVLNYRTEVGARRALRRLRVKYPMHVDCKADVVVSPSWLYPFRYLILVTGKDGAQSYWSKG
jgi:hypothetical protein